MRFEEEENFEKLRKEIVGFSIKGYEALSRIAIVNFRKEDGSQRKIYYLTDGLDTESVFSFSDKFKSNVVGTMQMESVEEYKTSRFGFVEQTDVFLASKLGLKRDGEFFIPRYMAFKTVQRIGNVLKSERKVEDENGAAQEAESENNEEYNGEQI